MKLEGFTRELVSAQLNTNVSADDFRRRFVTYFVRYAQSHAETTPYDYEVLHEEKDNLLKAMNIASDLQDWESVQSLAEIIAIPISYFTYLVPSSSAKITFRAITKAMMAEHIKLKNVQNVNGVRLLPRSHSQRPTESSRQMFAFSRYDMRKSLRLFTAVNCSSAPVTVRN